MITVKLDRPLQLDDMKVEKIELDLENLNGADVLEVENQLRIEQKRFNIYDQGTLVLIAAKAAKMIPDDLHKLSISDFMEVTGHVQLFLFGQASQTPQTSEEQS